MVFVKKYIIFRVSGRFGNAIFRYLASVLFCIKYNFDFILEEDFNDKYIYYPGLDSPRNDIGFMAPNCIDLLKKECDKNNLCSGFNTLGFFKSFINSNSLESNQFINNYNGNGLYEKNYIIINDNNFFDYYNNNSILDKNIIMDGFFQFDEIYSSNKKEITEYILKNNHYIKTDDNNIFYLKDLFKDLNPTKIYDIVIHIRLSDFINREDFIEDKYLIALFPTIDFNYKKIAIICNSINENDLNEKIYIENCLKWFEDNKLTITIESNNIIEDFLILKNAKVLVCSNSTLSWSASLFSDKLELCYIPNYSFYKIENRITNFKKPIDNTILYKVNNNESLKLKVIILTLENQMERKNNIQLLLSIFKQLGLEIEIYYGINGNDIKIYDTEVEEIKLLYYKFQTYYYNKKIRLNNIPMKKGEFGCAWSHLNIYNKLLNDNEYDNYLILEDDAILNTNLEYLMEHLLNLPENYDVCHIGESNFFPFQKHEKPINNFYYNINKIFFNTSSSLIISKKGASKILNFNKNNINIPSDDLISLIHYLSTDFNLHVPEKFIFKQDSSNISIIQKINNNNYNK